MKAREIFGKIEELGRLTRTLESELVDGGGEWTSRAEEVQGALNAVHDLLLDDGIDELGRWLVEKEAERDALKAEKAYIDRQLKAVERTTSYIKACAGAILRATGKAKVKGERGYAFAVCESVTTAVDKERLNGLYLERAQEAVRAAGVPDWVGVTLTASVKAVPDGEELPEVFTRKTEETARFTKPRKAGED